MSRQHIPWGVALVLAFLACVSTKSGPARTEWEYWVTWTQYGAGRLGDESKQDFEDFYNELGKEGWEYCGNAGTRDTMQYEQGWALNLWKRPR